MQIGQFAKICGTEISVLRHYDKEGLITPDFIDKFTGYRYYSSEQIEIFKRIAAMKKAGFSLKEIKSVLENQKDDAFTFDLIKKKKAELEEMIRRLDEFKTELMGGFKMNNNVEMKIEVGNEFRMKPFQKEQFLLGCQIFDEMAARKNYQRISGFRTEDIDDGMIQISADVISLYDRVFVREDKNITFVNDERVIGKWEVLGDFVLKEDFLMNMKNPDWFYGDKVKEIYFLPDGKGYWIFGGWSNGYIINSNGDYTVVNQYEVEEIDGSTYMFVQNKSYEYMRGGNPTILVLRQLDHERYTADGIARKDNINMSFVHDGKILGKWNCVGYCRSSMEEFNPKNPKTGNEYFTSIEFFNNGSCKSIYRDNVIVNSPDSQTWTKGCILYKDDSTACAYEFKTIDGKEYMFLEWKSGDYRWGGFDTNYYVFERA